jgi:preprotein translocase subunit SecY
MLVPSFIGETLVTSNSSLWHDVGRYLTDVFGQQKVPYYVIVFIFTALFTYFYTLVTYTQQNLAENLQKQGGFIPGIRPGKPTHDYITRVLVRITAAGALFLGLIAVMPYFATVLTNVQALTISGTALLIVVGVVLDTMKQLEAQLQMRNYSGFIR